MAPFSRAPLNLTTSSPHFLGFGDLAEASSHGVRGGRARALIGREVQLPRTLLRPLCWSDSAQSPYQAGFPTDPPIVLAVQHPRRVCLCVCVFTKLHITAQSGPAILVILCHSHCSSVCVCVCVCVFFPFILDIKFVGRTSRGHTGGRPHRIFHPLSYRGDRLCSP